MNIGLGEVDNMLTRWPLVKGVGFCCCLFSVPVSAPTAAALPELATTIGQVITGVSETAGVQIAAAVTEVAVAELGQSQSDKFPVVTVDAQDTLAGDSITNEPEYILRIEQMLLDWGQSTEDVLARESAVEARKSAEREALLDAALQAVEGFFSIHIINQKLASNQGHRLSLRELQEMMRRRVENSVSPSLDLQEVTSRIDLLGVADQRLMTERRKHQLTLIRLAGVSVEEPSVGDCRRSTPLDEESLVREALASSPTLNRLRHEADIHTFDERALEAMRFPGVVGGYRADSKLDGNEFDQRAYLALRYELQTGGDLNARMAEMRAKSLEQRALHRRDAEVIAQTVGTWVSTYKTSIYLADTYRRVVSSKVGQTESHLRRFLVGRSSWRDVLGAQQEIVESMAARIDASGAICLASTSLSLLAGGTHELR